MNLDHVVELQILKSVASSSGLCDVINALVAADSTQSAVSLLTPAYNAVNNSPNLFFVTKSVNSWVRSSLMLVSICFSHGLVPSQKKTVTGRVLKGAAQSPDKKGQNPDVKAYLAEVGSSGTTAAKSVDTAFSGIIAKAEAVVKAAGKSPSKAVQELDKAVVSEITINPTCNTHCSIERI